MTEVVPGRRTIRRVPTAAPDRRREGRIDAEGRENDTWFGGTIGEVVDQMNHDLGPVEDARYHVEE